MKETMIRSVCEEDEDRFQTINEDILASQYLDEDPKAEVFSLLDEWNEIFVVDIYSLKCTNVFKAKIVLTDQTHVNQRNYKQSITDREYTMKIVE